MKARKVFGLLSSSTLAETRPDRFLDELLEDFVVLSSSDAAAGVSSTFFFDRPRPRVFFGTSADSDDFFAGG